MAKGKSFSGFLSSPDANPTLFQASIENSEPTIAAPTTGRMASVRAPPAQKFGPKFAVIAAAFRPIVNPSKIRAASAAVLIAVSEVWMNAAVRTPRTLIHVSSTIDAMAKIRWRENPTMMSPMGCGKCTVVPSGTSGTTVHFPQPIGDIIVGFSRQRIFAIASIVLLTWINVRGVRTAAFIQTSLTAIKTAALAALILLGLTIGRNAAAITANFGPNFWAGGALTLAILPVVGAAMVGSLFSMDAWNNVGFASGELKNPEKDLPFAMAAGVLTVTTLYVLANVAYLNVLPADAIAHAPQDRVGTAAMQAMFGPAGLYMMAIAIMISTFGCNNGLILSGARVYYAMAEDNLFFKSAANLHPRYRTPALALVVQAVWTCVLCLSGTYGQLLNFVIFAAVVFYTVTAIGLFRLRTKRPDLPRPVRAPGYPILPALYVVLTGLIAVDLVIQPATRTYSMLGLLFVLIGVPVYYLWRRKVAPQTG